MTGARRLARALPSPLRRALARLAPEDAKGASWVDAAARALRDLPASGARPVVLAYHPRVKTNPYQRMLYGACAERGIAPVNLSNPTFLRHARAAADLGADVVFHVHWTHKPLEGATTEGEAADRLEAFTTTLDRFVADGGRIVWTLHNVLPHEARFPEWEARVCRAIADRAAAIHVMCDATREAAAAWYEIPAERTVLIPHASYLGVYPNELGQADARARLGLDPGDTVLTVFGGLRRYKGLDVLLDAFEAASAADPRLRLVIAGRPIAFDDLDAFRARAEANPAIRARLEAVPDDEIQVYLNAADVVVLPHSRVLNSGLVGLAYAFARPVIAPRIGCVAPHVTPDTGRLFEPDDRDSLRRALAAAPGLRDERFRTAALERARAYPPAAMAADFAGMVRSIVEGGT